MPFTLSSIQQNGNSCLRLTYNTPPIQLDVSGSNDALNPTNYEVNGPIANLISSVVPVLDDPSSVDVYLEKPMISGIWSLKVTNVEAP